MAKRKQQATPRAIWSGSIAFGLVNVPVRMHRAIDERDLHFHLLHTKDDSRIGYEKVCKKEGKPVPDGEIGRAYEVGDGKYVYLSDDDLAVAEGSRHKTIEIHDFVPYEEIDPIYFGRSYYLAPAEGGEKVYALLARAMEASGLAGIATYVMREKQQLGCLRLREGVITLATLYHADEIRPVDELDVGSVSVDKRELEMAAELIDRFTGSFEIEKYHDEYREAVLRVIEAKRKGREVRAEPREEPEVPDLMEALRASLADRSPGRSANGRRGAERNGGLDGLSKSELEQRAKRAGVRGYSKMRKAELVDALRTAG